jgi:small subunit ribosomal protein S17
MGRRKEFIGEVVSAKMQKTAVVRVQRIYKHGKYSKIMRRYIKFKVHDENGLARPGDTVRIEESRPISKEKSFRLVEVTKKAALPEIELKEELA